MRAVVNVATGTRFIRGQQRLTAWLAQHSEDYLHWNDRTGLPAGSPSHQDVPYAFKAYALKCAVEKGATTLLWCDASIIPIRPVGELWTRIERDGYWIGNNGFSNYEWTADLSYVDLFASMFLWEESNALECARAVNRHIPHVVATSFGLSLKHPIGQQIFDEYYRLASETEAFCGPWFNELQIRHAMPHSELIEWIKSGKCAPCGPPDVRGHRHDQTALSVIAWRLGCQLTNSPEVFSYRGGENEKTILVADGAY